ncbi:MAG: glycoside hydrolase family 88 protein [Mediterranea sp.]|jgi:unsaturated rhamnogalacturonyl hydrolase|nr:glycoside hydrolase family 88 protein [Mediterranea sp.]
MKKILYFAFLVSFLFSCKRPDAPSVVYSQEMVESLVLKTFVNNKHEQQLATANWSYVPGLVAFGVLKAWKQYPEHTEYYDVVKAYADFCLNGRDTVKVGESNIDDLAAGKILFMLYETEIKKGNEEDAERYKACATFLRNKLKFHHKRIDNSKPGAGGFFHKAIYPNQMWLDGLYMGPSMYAEWQAMFGEELGEEDNARSWSDIALQFTTIHRYTYDKNKKLNYHGWSADPSDPNSFWACRDGEYKGCSPEFWGRGMGWYFAAVIDVLELMPDTHPDYPKLVSIADDVAGGLALYQDKQTGSWYQLLQYDHQMKSDHIGDTVDGKVYNVCDKPNYLEASASAMFTYAYLKGMRLGVLDRKAYLDVAEKAYRGLLDNFIRKEENGDLRIIQSCASAGLGPSGNHSRTGTINYYLCGNDVTIVQNEGKAVGSFIMASLEFELWRTTTP